MNRICLMKNTIQPYAWGSHTAIAELLGAPSPTTEPQAELWLGAHPKAPSAILVGGEWASLDAVIENDPETVLGDGVVRAFGRRLPYLFKVLAADKPLSIQAHPNRDQAREGYLRENRAGIPLDAPHRNYRDDNHKPELLCALSLFWALCGFRSAAQIHDNLARYCPRSLSHLLVRVQDQREADRTRAIFETLMGLSGDLKKAVVDEAVKTAGNSEKTTSEAQWVIRLSQAYPGDIGVLAPLLLNLVCIAPGEAVFLPAGQLHAYLQGTGIELMANSDNVLRGGLTQKHVDLAQLLKVLDFRPLAVKKRLPEPFGPGVGRYGALAAEFCLSRIRVDQAERPYQSGPDRGVEILLCVQGQGRIQWGKEGDTLNFGKGDAILAPAGAGTYEIRGNTTLYKAGVPEAS